MYDIYISQDDLIKDIAQSNDIDIGVVRRVFESMEDCIVDYVSMVEPDEDVTIKPFSGLSINRKHVSAGRNLKGFFRGRQTVEHVIVDASFSRYFNDKVNKILFGE